MATVKFARRRGVISGTILPLISLCKSARSLIGSEKVSGIWMLFSSPKYVSANLIRPGMSRSPASWSTRSIMLSILKWMGKSVDRSNLSFYPSFPWIYSISCLMSHPKWIKKARQWLHCSGAVWHSQFDMRVKSASFLSHVASFTTAREP